jgi:hypothetical protein
MKLHLAHRRLLSPLAPLNLIMHFHFHTSSLVNIHEFSYDILWTFQSMREEIGCLFLQE